MRSFRPNLINRDYARLWYGQAISTIGDFVFSTTLVLWVATVLAKGEPWAPAAVSGVLLAMGVAVLFVGPLAGVFVDRWNTIATMLRTEVVRGVLVGVLTAVAFLPVDALPVGVWLGLIYTIVFALNAAGQFFRPARFAIIGDVVTGEADRARAAGITQATAGTAAIIGPPLAAPLLFTVGLQWALLLNAASYAVSYIAIRSVKLEPAAERDKPGARQTGLRTEFVAGLRFFGRSKPLVALLTIAVIGQCGMGALNTLNVFFLSRNLHASDHLYGYLGTALGVGGIVGALSAGRVVKWIGARATTCIGLLAAGALMFAYARQTAFLGGVALLFLFEVPMAMVNTAASPLLLASAPKQYIGRVMAVFFPVTQLATMLAALLAGWLASYALQDFTGSLAGLRFGPIDTIFLASGVLLVIAGVYARIVLPRSTTEPATAVRDVDPADKDGAPAGSAGER
jgi:MFS family permease